MEWTSGHDVKLVREILITEPYQHKPGSRESGKAWETIAENLRKSDKRRFTVTQRSVRDRFKLLQNRFKISERKELAASGISPEPTELDAALEEIMERMSSCIESRQKDTDSQKEKEEREKKSAQEMRKQALETLGQTKKRKKESEGSEKGKKTRKGGSETVMYLREKAELERENKKEELRLKALEIEVRKEGQNTMHQHQAQHQQQMQQQQMQQHNQLQQTLGLLATQQQQMIQLLARVVEKK